MRVYKELCLDVFRSRKLGNRNCYICHYSKLNEESKKSAWGINEFTERKLIGNYCILKENCQSFSYYGFFRVIFWLQITRCILSLTDYLSLDCETEQDLILDSDIL